MTPVSGDYPNPISRFFDRRRAKRYRRECEEELEDFPQELEGLQQQQAPVSSQACVECGGLFLSEKLSLLFVVTIPMSVDWEIGRPLSTEQLYCAGCRPKAAIRFELQDCQGHEVEVRLFGTQYGMLAEVDENGQDIFPVTIEEYGHLFCEDCGEFISEGTRCSRHPEVDSSTPTRGKKIPSVKKS